MNETFSYLKILFPLSYFYDFVTTPLYIHYHEKGTLTGSRRGGEDGSTADYIEDSGATGPELPNSSLLFASEKIPLVDIIAIVGRIQNKDSLCDWKNLQSVKDSTLSTPVMWLPRKQFKENVRSSKFLGWPVDENGEPVGGRDLEAAEKRRISQKNAVIGDAGK